MQRRKKEHDLIRGDVVMTKVDLDPGKVLVINDFLSGEECAALIQKSESFTYERGTVADVVIEDVRNNERVLLDDGTLAADLFHRAEAFLPAEIDGHGLVGFNERWRFYRYQPGQTFKPHRDGSYMRMKPWEESEFTFMIYLNDGRNVSTSANIRWMPRKYSGSGTPTRAM